MIKTDACCTCTGAINLLSHNCGVSSAVVSPRARWIVVAECKDGLADCSTSIRAAQLA